MSMLHNDKLKVTYNAVCEENRMSIHNKVAQLADTIRRDPASIDKTRRLLARSSATNAVLAQAKLCGREYLTDQDALIIEMVEKMLQNVTPIQTSVNLTAPQTQPNSTSFAAADAIEKALFGDTPSQEAVQPQEAKQIAAPSAEPQTTPSTAA